MPELQEPPFDPHTRVTPEELDAQTYAPGNPLGDKELFPARLDGGGTGMVNDGQNTEQNGNRLTQLFNRRKQNQEGNENKSGRPVEDPAAKKIEEAKATAEAAKSGDVGAIANQKIKEQLGDGITGRAAALAAKAVQVWELITRALAGDVTAMWQLLKMFGKPLLIFGLLLMIPAISFGVGAGGGLAKQGKPALGVGTLPNGSYTTASCSYMQSSINVPDLTSNQTYTLWLPETSGLYSDESYATVDSQGQPRINQAGDSNNGAPLAPPLWDHMPAAYKTLYDNDAALKWYATARWGYVAASYSHGQSNDSSVMGFKGLPPPTAWGGIKLIMGAKQSDGTYKWVLLFIGEYGPGAAENNSKGAAQQNLWNTLPEVHNGYRIMDPTGYNGRIAGSTPAVKQYLGIDSDSPIVIGFAPASWDAPGDTHQLGPLQCPTVQNNAGSGKPINLPLVQEGSSGECGNASAFMVALYYNANYTNSILQKENGVNTATGRGCLSPDMLQNATGKNYIDATIGTGTNNTPGNYQVDSSLQPVINSVNAGDPVIIYTSPDAIYGSAKHIFVITGYNAANQTFDVTSPKVGGDDVNISTTKDGNNTPITAAYLVKDTQGDSNSNLNIGFGHAYALVIQQQYLTPTP